MHASHASDDVCTAELANDGGRRVHAPQFVAIRTTTTSRDVADSTTDWRSGGSYVARVEKKLLAQWVRTAAERAGGQAKLARALSAELRRSIDRAAVNKMTLGMRDISADELLAIEHITEMPIPSPNIANKIPLVDWVSAGKLAEPKSQIPVEQVPLLAFADLGRGDFFALTVQGNSMDRVSPEGSVIVVDRTDRTLVSGKYYVFAMRGETTFKIWHGGDPPYLAPFSTDPVHTPIFPKRKRDLEVVGRVKRTFMDL
jgi:SOS-response transcriptional repressor LexA